MLENSLIYIVEDEPDVADIVAKYLEKEGYAVKVFYRGDDALEEIKNHPPALAILDIMLPGADGISILKEVRKELFFPVIFLTCKGDEVDRVLGLELGADDYISKPFSPRELVAKVRSLLRRIEYDRTSMKEVQVSARKIESRLFKLDLLKRKLFFGNASTELTSTEFALLELLMKQPGRIFLREDLIKSLWGSQESNTRTIDVHMGNLRKKIKILSGNDCYIRGVRSVGYAFED